MIVIAIHLPLAAVLAMTGQLTQEKTHGADRVTKYTWMEASPSEDTQNGMTTFQKTLGSLGIKCCSSGEYPWAMIEKMHRLFALQPFTSDENQVSRWKRQRVQFGFQSFFRSSLLLNINVSTLEFSRVYLARIYP